MAVVKSKIIETLSKNYPSFFKKDLSMLVEIILSQIEITLKKKESVSAELTNESFALYEDKTDPY